MPPKTRKKLRADSFANINQAEGRSKTSAAEMNRCINDAYREVLALADWPMLHSEFEVTFAKTELAAAASIGDSSLTVDSNAGFYPGQKVMLYSSTDNFELVEIDSLSSTDTINLDEDLVAAHSIDDVVSGYSGWIPYDSRGVLTAHLRTDQVNSKWDAAELDFFTAKDFAEKHGDMNAIGDQPTSWVLDKLDDKSIDFTADTGTDATNFIHTGSAHTDEIFDGWLLINETTGLCSRIYEYDAGTKTFELISSITGQADGDEASVSRREMMILLYPAPLNTTTVYFEEVGEADSLNDDFSVPVLPDEWHGIIDVRAAIIAIGDDAKKEVLRNSLEQRFEFLRAGLRRAQDYGKGAPIVLTLKKKFCQIP